MPRELSYDVDGRIAVLTYDRPPVNAVHYEDLQALADCLAEAPVKDELAVVFETGGDVFSGGHDVTEFTAEDVPDAEGTREIYLDAFEAVYEFPLPLIAAVEGPAVGAGAIDCQPDWPAADYAREREYVNDLRGDAGAAEAATAFLEGRDPDFEG